MWVGKRRGCIGDIRKLRNGKERMYKEGGEKVEVQPRVGCGGSGGLGEKLV